MCERRLYRIVLFDEDPPASGGSTWCCLVGMRSVCLSVRERETLLLYNERAFVSPLFEKTEKKREKNGAKNFFVRV